MVCGALALSSALRIRLEFGKPGAPEAFINPAILYVLASIIWLFAFSRSDVYGPRRSPQIWGELWNILIGHTIASFIFFGILYLVYRDFSRVQAGYFIAIALVPEDQILEVGGRMAAVRGISHCYQRPTYADWPYSVFTMAHGRSKEECDAILDGIADEHDLHGDDRAVLYSSTEFKKIRLHYFTDDYARWEAENS